MCVSSGFVLEDLIFRGANSAWDEELDFVLVQGVEMGETLLRNSQLEVVLGAGVAAGCLDPSCSVEEEEVEIRRWVKL